MTMTNKRVTLVAKDGTEISGELVGETKTWYSLTLATNVGINSFLKNEWTLKRSLPTYDYAVVKIAHDNGSSVILTHDSSRGSWTSQSGLAWDAAEIERYDWVELVEKGAEQ